MNKWTAPESIPLSFLNAIEYCPRRFYYEFVQGDMLKNEFVLEGELLHERADQPGQHTTSDGETRINHIQLCAQAMCLEERLPARAPIPYGYIFYYGSRKRVQVHFTPELRAKTRATIELAFQVAVLATPPPPLDGKAAARCRDCSLISLCLPAEVKLLKEKKRGSLAYTLPD